MARPTRDLLAALALAACLSCGGTTEEGPTQPEARVEFSPSGYPICVGAEWQEQNDPDHLLCHWECVSFDGRDFLVLNALVTADGRITVADSVSGVCP